MKKRLFSIILSVAICFSALAFTACSGEIEQSSKIQRMIMTFDFYDAAGNVVDTKNVQAKLYLNFAPETTKRFIALAEDGYFDNTCVSDVDTGYFEFGSYEYVDGNLTAKSFDTEKYPTLKGEFSKNGWVGNKLTASAGALIFKHDTEGSGELSKYDTAKGTIIVALSTTSKFSASEYCVFGKLCSDDAEDNPSSLVSDSSVNRSGKSSLAVAQTVADLVSNDGVRTYYYEKEGVFYTKVTEDGETEYFAGTTTDGEALTGDELEKIQDLVSDADPSLKTIPYTKVVIRSIKKK